MNGAYHLRINPWVSLLIEMGAPTLGVVIAFVLYSLAGGK